ncbi:sugar phosphate isomerase/epimerase family protein [Streptomyces sp. PU10]|uniref:sugar phosphate isomerase/epimerase family protein n=1 Tax=unclassified Streptomyces TaxID=2593676 RepID=UPI0015922A05|nr:MULTISPECIES: sugar phosphate isomerase/epimerase family protein [unclassified Streptomyces]MBH5131931.1 sugar phosphate isomerase/epimerase [Streptomyces sp. HB-N217]MDU0254037.1 sugar phosphate isomerase/epimerase family protein [Streptomyces sp. PU10]QKW63192.1 sugar phosphate isomerase/epimerase [Streptomyces sp. NA03103]
MKLAFSTLGVPGLPLNDVLGLATAHGYHGVELRAHPEEPVHPGLGPDERAAVAAQFEAAGVEVLGVAGYARVAAPGDDEAVIAEMRGLLDLARDLGAPYIRVFPGGGTEQSAEEADAVAARRLGTAAEYAAELGVRILLETHDSHCTGADAMRVLGLVGHRQAGALWDVMHTWLGGEQPSESYAALSPHLGYVQVKDIASAEDTTPLALGAGVLPLTEVVDVLSRHGWDGWLCWEYEKRWYESAAPLPELLGQGREHLARLLTDAA